MESNEAPVVMFTNYKRPDGFEVSLTLRGNDLPSVATLIDTAIKKIIESGGVPAPKGFQKAPPKPVEYIEGRVCPKDGGRLIKPPVGTNRPIKCENSHYDFKTKTSSGCDFIEWPKSGYEKDMERAEMGGDIEPDRTDAF